MHGQLNMMHLQHRQVRAIGLAVLLSAVALGCAGTGAPMQGYPPPAPSPLKHDKQLDPGDPWTPSPGQKYRGQLPSSLDSYRGDAPTFYQLIARKGWNGFRASRRCTQVPDCRSGAPAEMVVQAIKDAHVVPSDFDRSIPGVVIGRMYNDGIYRDSTTNIPGRAGPHPTHYYLVIERATKDSARLRIAVVSFLPDGRPDQQLTILETTKGYVSCHHKRVPPPEGFADFSLCPNAPHEWVPAPTGGGGGGINVSAIRNFAGSRTPRASTHFVSDPGWFSCPEGCCSGEFTVP